MTTREIDDLLFRLLGSVNGDARHLGFVEPAVLIFGRCLEQQPPAICDQHIRPHAHSIIHALRPEFIPTLGYRVLCALPVVLERIAASAPEAIPSDFEKVGDALARTQAWHRRLLGEEKESADGAGPDDSFIQPPAGVKEPPGTPSKEPRARLALVWDWQRGGNDLSIGKTISAGLDLVLAGEWSMRKTFEPLVAFSERIREYNDPFARQMRTAVALAEGHFLRQGVGEIRRLPREYIFHICAEESPPDWLRLFSGGSAGLGLTLLALAKLDTLDLRRRQRLLRGDVVFTGEVDPAGNVLAVDRNGIAPKIEAAFYSTSRTFVLPRGNLEQARGILALLTERHPRRRLELFPVGTVSEAYEDGRVTEPRQVRPLKVTAARARRRRKTLAAGFAALAAALMLGILLPPRLDREIVTYDFDGGRIRFYNRYGYNFDSFKVPYHIAAWDNIYHDISAKSHRLVLDNINGDPATRELVFISVESHWNHNSPVGRIHVHLFSSRGRLLQHVAPMPEIKVIWPDSTRIYTDFTYCLDSVEDIDGDGFKEVLISFTETLWWPSGIINVSLLRGDYQVFLHRGHMKHFITVDSEKPGKKLIVAGGRNNRDSIDVVAVLDPERMHGMTPPPERSGLEIPGFENNVAMHYIAIPASDLREVQSGIGRPYIEKIRRDDKGRVRISVLENSDVLLRNAILYYLDSAWRCAEIQYSDAYISAFRLGLGGVDITERLERQTQRLKREFRYYTGSGFSDSPVINAGYLAGGGKPPASGASLVQD